VLFNKPLGNSGSGRYNGLLPYSSGLVVWWGSQFRYFDYSGNEQTPVDITLGSGESVVDVAGGTTGTVFAMVVKNQSPTNNCPYGQVASRVLAFNGSGQVWQYSVLDCQQYLMFRSTPSNGAVFGGTNVAGVDQLTAIGSNGSPMWANPYKPDSGDDGAHVFIGSRHFNTFVDNNGNVVVLRWYRSEDNQYQGAQVSIVDGSTGSRRSVLYTSDLDPTKSFDVQPTNIGMNAGRLYIVATTCTSGTCSSGDPYLYAVQVPILGMDFPRAAALGQTPQPPAAELKYVAMGDSFSSGEGVSPFDSSTDVPSGPSKNLCHRSSDAYARQLDRDPAVSLQLVSFAACSGAKTDQINGVWSPNDQKNANEPAQDTALSSSTDVVTVSIGGNDVQFSDFVQQCLFLDCSAASVQQSFAAQVDNLGSKLDGAYNDILTKAPNATVYVVGYPQIMPDPSTCSNPLGAGITAFNALVAAAKVGDSAAIGVVAAIGQLAGVSNTLINNLINAGQVTFTSNEITAGRVFTAALNSKIEGMVNIVNSPRLKFVNATASGSPFAGHELCTTDPYFNGLDIVNVPYSFHPNQFGQDAYRQLVLSQF